MNRDRAQLNQRVQVHLPLLPSARHLQVLGIRGQFFMRIWDIRFTHTISPSSITALS